MDSLVLTKMAKVVVTIRIMPESPDSNLVRIRNSALSSIKAYAGNTETKVEEKPVAFGLKAVEIIFVMEESKGSPDTLVEKIGKIEGVNSAEITDVRRAIG